MTQALHGFMGFGAEELPAQALRYPPPDTPHPVGEAAQAAKLRQAWLDAGPCPVTAYVHSYGPVDDVLRRFEGTARAMTAAPGGCRLWINRYGYLSDDKIRRIGESVRSRARP